MKINVRTGTIALYIGLNSYYSMFVRYEQASTPYNEVRMDKSFYTVPEVATSLQVTEKTVRAWIRDRKLTAIRVGREWRIREVDIQEFVDRHLSTAVQEIHATGN
jgi:excisionase family DNA binding protein